MQVSPPYRHLACLLALFASFFLSLLVYVSPPCRQPPCTAKQALLQAQQRKHALSPAQHASILTSIPFAAALSPQWRLLVCETKALCLLACLPACLPAFACLLACLPGCLVGAGASAGMLHQEHVFSHICPCRHAQENPPAHHAGATPPPQNALHLSSNPFLFRG